jgi:hypothetical protein
MDCSFLFILPYFSLVSHLFEMTIGNSTVIGQNNQGELTGDIIAVGGCAFEGGHGRPSPQGIVGIVKAGINAVIGPIIDNTQQLPRPVVAIGGIGAVAVIFPNQSSGNIVAVGNDIGVVGIRELL